MLKYENVNYMVKEKEKQDMAAITNDWLGPLSSEFKKPYYKELYKTVTVSYTHLTLPTNSRV